MGTGGEGQGEISLFVVDDFERHNFARRESTPSESFQFKSSPAFPTILVLDVWGSNLLPDDPLINSVLNPESPTW